MPKGLKKDLEHPDRAVHCMKKAWPILSLFRSF